MNFVDIVRATIKMNRIGYYAARQEMLKNGATLKDVHKALVFRLRILGG
jgi:hypothetical protein